MEAMQNQAICKKLAMPPILDAVQDHVTSKKHSEGGGEHRLNIDEQKEDGFRLRVILGKYIRDPASLYSTVTTSRAYRSRPLRVIYTILSQIQLTTTFDAKALYLYTLV